MEAQMGPWPEMNWTIPYAFKERFYSSGLNGEVFVREDANKRPLDSRTDLHHYAATFEWGNDTEGAMQLSLALLADAVANDAIAQSLHQKFKRRVIIDLPERWTITRSRILAHARMLERSSNWITG
jgi:Family of unknown function (DUF6166)